MAPYHPEHIRILLLLSYQMESLLQITRRRFAPKIVKIKVHQFAACDGFLRSAQTRSSPVVLAWELNETASTLKSQWRAKGIDSQLHQDNKTSTSSRQGPEYEKNGAHLA